MNMKKILLILFLLLGLVACKKEANIQKEVPYQHYSDMKQLILENDKYTNKSSYMNINAEIAKTAEGSYRYYIFIDNPKVAMYDVKAMALVSKQDYTNLMAANFGIFDDIKYNLVPNQILIDKGYLKGFVMSGITENANVKLKLLIQWQNEEHSDVFQEFVELNLYYR